MRGRRRGRLGAVCTAAAVMAAAVAGCAGDDGSRGGSAATEPWTARWIDKTDLHETGFGKVTFEAKAGNSLVALTYRSSSFDPEYDPIWFVMHGASRDVERYIEAAAPVAERYDALAIAIHFPRQDYPTSDDYTLSIYEPGSINRWRDPGETLYAEIEYVYAAVRATLGGGQTGYYLFGHSAGAQFVHRLLTFLPGNHVIGAVAANAGWYTLPTAEDSRYESMPYGLVGGPVAPGDLSRFFAMRFVVMAGEHDTTTAADDDLVRGTPEAEAQGATRLERGLHYYATADRQASSLGAHLAWVVSIVPKAAHDAGQVIDSAGFLTFVPNAQPCPPTSAADAGGVMITEILADPPDGAAGDANGDGVRDPAEDEFVEIVNTGPQPVCLAGWTLGDADVADRHVFPIGPPLAPGQTLVVFGGGVPTGRFGGAQVQWADGRLSLSNTGDVLFLRDATGAVVDMVSWGDGASSTPAKSHWDGSLGIERSLVREPVAGATWGAHPDRDGHPFSPGTAAAAP
jgi:hypothetical protein